MAGLSESFWGGYERARAASDRAIQLRTAVFNLKEALEQRQQREEERNRAQATAVQQDTLTTLQNPGWWRETDRTPEAREPVFEALRGARTELGLPDMTITDPRDEAYVAFLGRVMEGASQGIPPTFYQMLAPMLFGNHYLARTNIRAAGEIKAAEATGALPSEPPAVPGTRLLREPAAGQAPTPTWAAPAAPPGGGLLREPTPRAAPPAPTPPTAQPPAPDSRLTGSPWEVIEQIWAQTQGRGGIKTQAEALTHFETKLLSDYRTMLQNPTVAAEDKATMLGILVDFSQKWDLGYDTRLIQARAQAVEPLKPPQWFLEMLGEMEPEARGAWEWLGGLHGITPDRMATLPHTPPADVVKAQRAQLVGLIADEFLAQVFQTAAETNSFTTALAQNMAVLQGLAEGYGTTLTADEIQNVVKLVAPVVQAYDQEARRAQQARQVEISEARLGLEAQRVAISEARVGTVRRGAAAPGGLPRATAAPGGLPRATDTQLRNAQRDYNNAAANWMSAKRGLDKPLPSNLTTDEREKEMAKRRTAEEKIRRRLFETTGVYMDALTSRQMPLKDIPLPRQATVHIKRALAAGVAKQEVAKATADFLGITVSETRAKWPELK